MENMVTNVCVKSNYDRLQLAHHQSLRKFQKVDNNTIMIKQSKNNVHSDLGTTLQVQ